MFEIEMCELCNSRPQAVAFGGNEETGPDMILCRECLDQMSEFEFIQVEPGVWEYQQMPEPCVIIEFQE